MKRTLSIIARAYTVGENPVVAFSGGTDSAVLLDILYTRTDHRPPLLYVDDQMSDPATLPHVRETAQRYGARLILARADRTPLEQWQAQGWPMLGKLAARKWMQQHPDRGFRLDVSSCCRRMKIAPGRQAMKAAGSNLQFTGQRGQSDDALRGMRSKKDSSLHYVKTDKLWIANPLDGWTDTMIRRYVEAHDLPLHPARARGAQTIGCLFCGGGAQFDNSGFRHLRRLYPDAWRQLMVDWRAGEIVLAIKHDVPLVTIRAAIQRLGGLQAIARERPHVFDFLRTKPLKGYSK